MNSSYITTSSNSGSKLIKTPDKLSNYLPEVSIPSGTFGFRCIVQTPEVIIYNHGDEKTACFDVEFDIPFDDDMVPNEGEIRIYNLSKATMDKFKKGNSVSVTAGYGIKIICNNIFYSFMRHAWNCNFYNCVYQFRLFINTFIIKGFMNDFIKLF